MMTLFLPAQEKLEAMAESLRGSPLTYSEQELTKQSEPHGYAVDHNRVLLGSGEQCFERGKEALRDWLMFDLGWVKQVIPREKAPIEVGTIACVTARALGIWTVNFSRVIYTVDEDGDTARWGFAYGTTPTHVEKGEERFMVEWDKKTDEVHYDMLAFSKPRHILAILGYPFTRYCQKQFGVDVKKRMIREFAG